MMDRGLDHLVYAMPGPVLAPALRASVELLDGGV